MENNEDYFEKNIMNELANIRDDINSLATYINITEQGLKKITASINNDLKSLEEDIVKKISEVLNLVNKNDSNSTTDDEIDTSYIQQLIKDDFKDMQTNLLNQIREIVYKNEKGDTK